MKYLNPEWVFWSIALGFPRPGLSIIPHLHKKFVTECLLTKPNSVITKPNSVSIWNIYA